MSQDNQHAAPEEEAGGYGTPTAEQETGGPDNRQFAQPREEEDFDAAGLNQDDQPSTSRTSEPPRRRPHRRLCGCG